MKERSGVPSQPSQPELSVWLPQASAATRRSWRDQLSLLYSLGISHKLLIKLKLLQRFQRSIAHGQIGIGLAEREYSILSRLKFQYPETFNSIDQQLVFLLHSEALKLVEVRVVDQLH